MTGAHAAALAAALTLLAGCADRAPASPPPPPDAPALVATAAGTVAAWVAPDAAAPGDAPAVLWVQASGAAPVAVARGRVSGHTQAGPRLAALPGGALVAAYVEEQPVAGRRFPASHVRLVRSDDGGRTWGAPVTVSPDPGFSTGHTFHSLAGLADGTVLVAWLDGTARDRARLAAAPAEGAEGGHGGHGGVGPGTDLVVARSADGGRTFGAPVTVARGTCECCRTSLATGSDGAVYVAWRHVFDGDQRDVALARSDDGGRTFGAPTRVHRDGWTLDGCPHAGPAVAVGADGAVHVAWATGADGQAGLWHATSPDRGAAFGVPAPLARGPLGQVRAAAAPDGRVWLAWEEAAAARVGLVAVGQADTLYVPGTDPDLGADAAGWHLTWLDGAARRVRTGS